MKKIPLVLACLAWGGVVTQAQSQPVASGSKIAIINAEKLILSTKEGQKAQAELDAKFNTRKQALEKKQAEIQGLRDQVQRGSAAMSEDAKNRIARDIDAKTKNLQREGEDYDSDVQQEEGKIMRELEVKVMEVVIKFASANGYTMVLDVGNQQTPAIWWSPSVDITDDIIKLYDQSHPAAATAPAKPASPAPPKKD